MPLLKPSNQILKMYKDRLSSNHYRILLELEKTQISCWITLLSSQLVPCVDREALQLESWGSEATPSVNHSFKRSYKVSHPLQLKVSLDAFHCFVSSKTGLDFSNKKVLKFLSFEEKVAHRYTLTLTLNYTHYINTNQN